MTRLLLAVDGGQTSTRAVLADLAGRVVAATTAPAYDHPPTRAGNAAARLALRELVFALGPACSGVAAVCIGLTSIEVDNGPQAGFVCGVVRDIVDSDRIRVVPDRDAAFAGAATEGHGIVVLSGGGAIVFGVAPNGDKVVMSGYGYRIGEDGSAVDIGRRAVAAALRGWEARGRPTTLTEIVSAVFRVDDPREIIGEIYAPGFRRSRFASLAPAVLEAAESGDEVAAAIVDGAAEELSAAAAATARRLYADRELVPIFLAGWLLAGATPLTHRVEARLVRSAPAARLSLAPHASIVGALVLARRAAGLEVPSEWVVGTRQSVAARLG